MDDTEAHTLARRNAEAAFYLGKVASANYFAANILPTVAARCKCIMLADRTPLEVAQESFSA
jgi:hypothetical protein